MDQKVIFNLVQWISAILGLVGSGLMGQKLRVSWILWYISSAVGFLWAVWASVLTPEHPSWGFAFMQFIYVILAIRGWVNWGKVK